MKQLKAPPIKSQGIKTKLVPFIAENIEWKKKGIWIEPFLGSGAVVLNIHPQRALLGDANPNLVRMYADLQSGHLTPDLAGEFLREQGAFLSSIGEAHYYAVRDRFNSSPNSLDFLFLNRACFNGVIRFNKKGRFNVPFCRKPDRFRPALVTKITNQLKWARDRIKSRDYTFVVQDWKQTLAAARLGDFVYIDPPYVGRHADYYNSWSDEEADALSEAITQLPASFALSIWLKNKYRENEHVAKWFSTFPIRTRSHFYHVGSFEDLRNEMLEALILSKDHPYQLRSREQPRAMEATPLLL